LKIHVFGPLKKVFDPTAKLSEETIVNLPYKPNESLEQLLIRLNLSGSDYGECFINHTIVRNYSDIIPKDARVGIFSHGMLLIDGGLYLKKWKD